MDIPHSAKDIPYQPYLPSQRTTGSYGSQTTVADRTHEGFREKVAHLTTAGLEKWQTSYNLSEAGKRFRAIGSELHSEAGQVSAG